MPYCSDKLAKQRETFFNRILIVDQHTTVNQNCRTQANEIETIRYIKIDLSRLLYRINGVVIQQSTEMNRARVKPVGHLCPRVAFACRRRWHEAGFRPELPLRA